MEALPNNLYDSKGCVDVDACIAWACQKGISNEKKNLRWHILKHGQGSWSGLTPEEFKKVHDESIRRGLIAKSRRGKSTAIAKKKKKVLESEIQEIKDQMEFLALKRRVAELEMHILAQEANEHICPVG